jgi:hypothetical protein
MNEYEIEVVMPETGRVLVKVPGVGIVATISTHVFAKFQEVEVRIDPDGTGWSRTYGHYSDEEDGIRPSFPEPAY